MLFWWEGPDGSRILTMRIWKDYDPGNDIDEMNPHRTAQLFTPGLDHAALFVGVGDHGGAVTRAQIRKVLDLQKDPSPARVALEHAGAIFRRG